MGRPQRHPQPGGGLARRRWRVSDRSGTGGVLVMLTELLDLVESANTPMTCGQLADRLGANPEVVAGMLDRLSRQGRLQNSSTGPAMLGRCDPSVCGVAAGCASCPIATPPATGRRFLAVRPTSSGKPRLRRSDHVDDDSGQPTNHTWPNGST